METNRTYKNFLEAYEAHADAIFRHCYYRVFERERAKDLTQETFIKAWNYLAGGAKVDNMRALLYRIATNLVIDDSRKAKVDSLDSLMEGGYDHMGEDGRRTAERKFVGDETMALLAKLDEKHRLVVVMRYIDDLSPKEIAKALKESENVVSVRLHRALAKLRDVAGESETPFRSI